MSMTQYTVPTSPATFLGTIPPGGTMILSSNESSADVYLGQSSAVTASNGAIMDVNGPTTIVNPVTSKPVNMWGIAGTGSHVVGVMIVTPR